MAGLGVAFLLIAQSASAGAAGPAPAIGGETYGPSAPAQPPKKSAGTGQDGCAAASASADQRQIVICAQRPNGYRLNPDVMEAKREIRSGGPPPRPGTSTMAPDCARIGPAGCFTAGINLVAAAITAATMAERLAKGEPIGDMFITDPHPDEYHLYLAAKQRREAREAEAAAKAKARAAAAAAAAAKATPAEPGAAPQP